MIPSEYKTLLAPYMASAPVDVAGAARALGLEVYEAELEKGVSGLLMHDPSYGTPSGFVIFVNEKEAPVRQRFTAAHEIGHFVHHRDQIHGRLEDNYLLRAEGMSNREEVEANQFAAELLMPHGMIEQEMRNGHQSVDDLAARLKVSKIAMGIRLGLPT